MTLRLTTVTSLGAMCALVLSACGAPAPTAPATSAPGGDHATLSHVHGLGINPADGELYAATHHGVFRVPEQGEAVRIGPHARDTMGFTVAGPDLFLASGHPDPAEADMPPHLGLVESSDGAASWRTVSLGGEVDFHALEAKHDRVYGYDSQSGTLMTTTDRRTWDKRSDVALADIAISPENAETLLATTQDGPALSTDGGRTFGVIEGAPLLLLVDWPSRDRLVGVAPDGAVHVSGDGGKTWSRRGEVPGSPQALTTSGKSDIYVAAGDAIHRSADNGKTFGVLHPLG